MDIQTVRSGLSVLFLVVAVTGGSGFPTSALSDGVEPPRPEPQSDLSSWNDTPTKRSIVAFVKRVTEEGSPDFVPVSDRIAVFDNDGTLWSEQPMYNQLAFAIDRVQALSAGHPEWKDQPLFRAALDGNPDAVMANGLKGAMELLMATHTGDTTEEFQQVVSDWISTARHPRFNRPYTDLVYAPMVELLDYLRSNGFKTFIVSGGGVEFMRPWVEEIYGVPAEQTVGSYVRVTYEHRDGKPVLRKLPEIEFIDDGAGKPVGIHYHIGRRPIAAFGNSDGDFEMLEWVTSGDGPGFAAIVHHDDPVREFAYDRTSHFGKLDRGLAEAPARGWTLISMKQDWNRVFGFEAVATQ